MTILFKNSLYFWQKNLISTAQCLLCKRSFAAPMLFTNRFCTNTIVIEFFNSWSKLNIDSKLTEETKEGDKDLSDLQYFENVLLLKVVNVLAHPGWFGELRPEHILGFGLGKKVKTGKKAGPTATKKVLPVETDVNKLLTFVCGSNICKEGKDIAVKPDSEYPDWLWTIRTGPAPPLEEMDQNTKAYWRRLRRMGMNRYNKLAALRRF